MKFWRFFITGTIAIGLSSVCTEAAGTNSTSTTNVSARVILNRMEAPPERKPSPLFTGKELPIPHQQTVSWSVPDSDLPTNYIPAASLLFEQGLADPRGCDYREVEVGTGNVWSGDGGIANTHGWVLPGKGEQKFAICWNGLVYPVVSVGTKIDLDADVTNATKNVSRSWRSALPEAQTLSPTVLQGVKGCLLLRLGRTDLAKSYWLAIKQSAPSYNPQSYSTASNTDPYLDWAMDWAWSLFDRMICAHQRGDENLALADARQLSAAQPQIEAECAKRGFKRQPSYDSRRQKELQPYIPFLDQLPQLVADLERRGKEGSRISVITTGITNIADSSKRIAALIRDLDLISARQWGQPGCVNLPDDPIVSTLVSEGDAAVDPLLDCAENDQRLTRSVSFGRDFHRGRNVIPVKSAANAALKAILQTEFSSVAEARLYWNEFKHLKLEDRWYEILNNDAAKSRWNEAASLIVQPDNVSTFGGWISERRLGTNETAHMRGERLREKQNPSITELFVRNALDFPTNDVENYDLAARCQWAEYLAQWDPQAALPAAKTLSRRASTAMKYSNQQFGPSLTGLSLARAKAGDPNPFGEYAEWIVTTAPTDSEGLSSSFDRFEPLKKYPTNALLQTIAEKLFAETNSAWGNLPWKTIFGRSTLEPELLPLAGYRTLLRRELSKTDFCGSATLQQTNYIQFSLTNQVQSGGSFMFTLPAGSTVTNGTTAALRWSDWLALSLANTKQFKPFNPFVSVEDRDKAIQTLRSKLQKNDSTTQH